MFHQDPSQTLTGRSHEIGVEIEMTWGREGEIEDGAIVRQ
jgi:hypothetical protein